MSALVDVAGVSRRFGDLTAVDDVTMRVESGEVVGLLGANGAGKSTLIRLILGLIAPSAGTVRLFGEPPSRAGRSRLGYMPQGLGLYPDLTVSENIAFVADAFGSERPALDPDLAGLADRPVGEISLGFRRRTAFAAALSHRPELLLLDEPTSGVGPLGRAELWATIGRAASDGAGVLVSTHYMEEAEQCDRVLLLAAGRSVATGTAAEIAGSVRAVQVDTPDWIRALDTLDQAGMRPALIGTTLRVTNTETDVVRSVLAANGIEAEVGDAVAGFDEAFVALSAS